jgi:DNA-directed RNA polymerase specialized sigma24 family protein
MLIRWLPEQLQPIVLMKSEGHSFEAIAAAVGMSVEDVKRKYNSARTRLRSLLKKLLSRGEE